MASATIRPPRKIVDEPSSKHLMISSEYCQLMARYNRWMNERLYTVLSEITDDERKRDRGAFFGSMHGTLNHLLWGDRMWLGRFIDEPCKIGRAHV